VFVNREKVTGYVGTAGNCVLVVLCRTKTCSLLPCSKERRKKEGNTEASQWSLSYTKKQSKNTVHLVRISHLRMYSVDSSELPSVLRHGLLPLYRASLAGSDTTYRIELA
jgi:hypothetical protein